MRRTLISVALAMAFGAAAAAPDLDAIVSYRSEQILANGTTRVETWQERLVRRGDQVADERVLPPATAPHEHAGPSGHEHFSVDRMTRVLRHDDKGQLELAFVDRAERRVITVPRPEWAAVGFDGRYDAAAHLVPPSLIASLPAQPGPVKGTSWHVQKGDGWTHRVLWSDAKQVALRVESKRDDGSASRLVKLDTAPALAPAQLPWNGAAAYRQMVYDDFMD